MKKTFKITLFIFMIITLLVGGTVFAKENEFVINKKIIFENNKNNNVKNGFAKIMIGQIDFTSYADDIYLKVTPKPDTIEKDKYGNLYANYNLNGMLKGEKLIINIERRIKTSSFKTEETISARSNGSVTEENKLFIEPQTNVESNDKLIIDKANEITQGLTSDYKKAAAIFEFVNTQMSYTATSSATNKGALAGLNSMSGVCEEFATLFAAMCRAEEIPTKLIAGYKVEENNGKYTIVDHVWAEIYLDDYGWLPVEPTVIYTVNDNRLPYWDTFCALNSANYIPTDMFTRDNANIEYSSFLDALSSDGKILGSNEKIDEITLQVGDDIVEPVKNSFADLSMYTWAQDPIQSLFEKDIVEGYSNTEYGPERNISKIEFICMLSRTLEYLNENHVDDAYVYYYPSYNQNHWSKEEYDFLMKCYQFYTPSDSMSAGFNNIAEALGTNVDLNTAITRGEAVALMDLFIDSATTSNSFSDTRNSKFAGSVEKAYSMGIIEGYPDGTFRPNGYITRAEMAAVLGRYIEKNMYVM